MIKKIKLKRKTRNKQSPLCLDLYAYICILGKYFQKFICEESNTSDFLNEKSLDILEMNNDMKKKCKIQPSLHGGFLKLPGSVCSHYLLFSVVTGTTSLHLTLCSRHGDLCPDDATSDHGHRQQ